MSRPPFFTPPPGIAAYQLPTARGAFAVLDTGPETAHRGTVLLLPGYTGSKEDFIELLAPIAAAGYRAVAVDGRGQYETEGPDDDEAPYAMDELAQDVLAQAEAIGGGGRVHLLGHSLGGLVARAAVLRDAAPFASLTLVSSGPAQVSPSQQDRVKLLLDALTVLDMAAVWDAMQELEPPEDAAASFDEPTRPALRNRWLRTSPAQLTTTGRQLRTEPDRVAALARVPLPKHVLSGERDDVWPVPLLDSMAVRLDAHRTVIAGAEHSPNTDRPGPTAAALVAFWDDVTATV